MERVSSSYMARTTHVNTLALVVDNPPLLVLMRFAGKDATKPFERFHYPRGAGVKWGSESMYVGPLDEGEKKDNGSA
eukprot:1359832-Amorphochlora_amoeboformis.AAC.1